MFKKTKIIYRAIDIHPAIRPTATEWLNTHGNTLLILAVLLIVGIIQLPTYAASYTWDGEGATNNWSDCDNWSSNICPTSGDTVTFNATSTKNSVVDTSFGGTVTSLTMASGYTGTVSLDRSLTLSSAFVLGGASTFTAGAHDLQTNTFSLGAGTFNAPSATLTVSSTFNVTGGTFNHNNGTVTFNGGGSSIICNGATFNLVQLQNTGAKTVNSSCSLPLGTNPTVSNTITLSGSLTGSGTLTFAAGSIISSSGSLSGFTGLVTSALTVNGATLNLGSYSLMDINSTFILNSGSNFTAPAGEASFASTFTINAGATFNHNNGTVVIDGGSGTLTCNNTVFNLVRFENTATKTVSNGCILPLGTDPTLPANISLSGILSGSGTLQASGGTLSVQTTGALVDFSGLSLSSLTVAGTLDLSSYDPVDINNAFTLNSGSVFTAPSGDMTVGGTFTINAGATFNHNNGTVIFDGSSVATITCNNAAFNLVRFVNASNTKTVSAGCDLPLGDDPDVTRSIVLNGTLSGTGILNFSSANLTLNPGSALVGFDGLYVAVDFTLANNTSFDAGNYSTFDVDRAFTLSSGAVFTAPLGDMTVAGTFTANSGSTFNHNNGVLVFDGAASAVVTCAVPITLNQVIINKSLVTSSDFFRINNGCDLPLGTDPTVNFGGGLLRVEGELSGAGTLSASSGTLKLYEPTGQLTGFSGLETYDFRLDDTVPLADFSTYDTFTVSNAFYLEAGSEFVAPASMSVAGDFTLEPTAVFTSSSGTVALNGTDQTITGDITFHNLTKTITTPDILTFTAGSTQTIEGNLVFEGADANNLLSLVSNTPGTQWDIDAQGARTLQYLSVQDSNNINASVMLAYDSEDLGNNINWQFLATPDSDLNDDSSPTQAHDNEDVLPALGEASTVLLAYSLILISISSGLWWLRKRSGVVYRG